MKKILVLLYTLSCTFLSYSQVEQPAVIVDETSNEIEASINNNSDSIVSYIATVLDDINLKIFDADNNNRFKLYPTENMYNFLKLDTWTGRIEQVQWSLDSKEEGTWTINNENLALNFKSSFELYPTQNMYQFLLINKANGRTWHVQWGHEDKKRWIRRIY